MIKGFGDAYRGRKVLVTGHTGFKGSWLCAWLLELGADVIGYSLYLPSTPANFEVLNLRERLEDVQGDVRDIDHLRQVFQHHSPEIVFHLAAQAITRKSYDIPRETFFTNLGGTVNVLESLRASESVKAGVIITSDKCYQNVEWVWGYRENDRLGGDDPYSASKACAEIACHSYIKSFFSSRGFPLLSTARAGNVIGGGDWALDRIVPDMVRAFSSGQSLEIRSPGATRPWQHVLEPLSGYLWLGANLLRENQQVAWGAFNFGPSSEVNRSVAGLNQEFLKTWGPGEWQTGVQSDFKK
jgi:CDP-glucose 4,6-dehydratase